MVGCRTADEQPSLPNPSGQNRATTVTMDPDIFQAPEETRFKSQGSTRVLAVIALPALMSFYLAYVVKGW